MTGVQDSTGHQDSPGHAHIHEKKHLLEPNNEASAPAHDDGHADDDHGHGPSFGDPGWAQHMWHSYKLLIIFACLTGIAALLVATLVPLRHKRTGVDIWKYPVDEDIQIGLGRTWWPDNPYAAHEANSHFRIGLRALHVFWYDLAKEEFEHCLDIDPKYVMCYWGVAMASKKSLWMTEDPLTAQKALKEMREKGDMTKATERERVYIPAIKELWAPGKSMEEREKAYSKAMGDALRTYPDDVDACAFYALSLLSMTANSASYLDDAQEASTMKEARDVLGKCSARWWDHAGLLHYITHAYDEPDPAVAEKGLAAGLHLSEVAPAACHAQHMKSHLFLRLGIWSEVVDSNVKAVAASDRYCTREYPGNQTAQDDCDKDDKYHAMEWWLYGLTQQGAFNDAKALLGRMMAVYGRMKVSPFNQWALRMWAHTIMQSHATPDVPPLISPLLRSEGVPDLSATLKQVVAVTNASNALPTDDDLVWEVHARASALVAAAYALTLNTNATVFLSNQQSVKDQHAAIQSNMDFLLNSVPDSMIEIKKLITVYKKQVQALQMVSTCIQRNRLGYAPAAARATTAAAPLPPASSPEIAPGVASALPSALPGRLSGTTVTASSDVTSGIVPAGTPRCSTWIATMQEAVRLEEDIWGKTSITLQIAPAHEMFGHLLLLMQQQPANASMLFELCLSRLENRQSCVLGKARAALLAGNAGSASEWYGKLWGQCSVAAAPQDFVSFPGLVEAYFAINANATSTGSMAALTPVLAEGSPANTTTSAAAKDTSATSAASNNVSSVLSQQQLATLQAALQNQALSYSYGTIFVRTAVAQNFARSVNATDALQAYPPLVALPADMDPATRTRLRSLGYTYTAPLVQPDVANVGAGKVEYDSVSGTYQYVMVDAGDDEDSYWPSVDRMYSEALRAKAADDKDRHTRNEGDSEGADGGMGEREGEKGEGKHGRRKRQLSERGGSFIPSLLVSEPVYLTRRSDEAGTKVVMSAGAASDHDELRRDDRKMKLRRRHSRRHL